MFALDKLYTFPPHVYILSHCIYLASTVPCKKNKCLNSSIFLSVAYINVKNFSMSFRSRTYFFLELQTWSLHFSQNIKENAKKSSSFARDCTYFNPCILETLISNLHILGLHCRAPFGFDFWQLFDLVFILRELEKTFCCPKLCWVKSSSIMKTCRLPTN